MPQAAYDLRKLRGKHLVVKPDRSRRYHMPGQAARTIAALLACAITSSRPSSPECADPDQDDRPRPTPRIDRDYDHLRDGMRTRFHGLAIDAAA